MAWYNEEQPETLNFMVVGNNYSGYGLLQRSLEAHPHLVCHGDLFHANSHVRQGSHESYFGPSGKVPDWWVPTTLSVEQYLNNKIFDNTLHGERAVGVRTHYSLLDKYQLWDYVNNRCRHGDFCLIHVKRNPAAAYLDYQSNQRLSPLSGLSGSRVVGDTTSKICLDESELVSFVRSHQAYELKTDRLCGDRLSINYYELLLDFRASLEIICKFLEVRFSSACIPNGRHISRKDTRSRISNWVQLKRSLPSDVLAVLTASDLF